MVLSASDHNGIKGTNMEEEAVIIVQRTTYNWVKNISKKFHLFRLSKLTP